MKVKFLNETSGSKIVKWGYCITEADMLQFANLSTFTAKLTTRYLQFLAFHLFELVDFISLKSSFFVKYFTPKIKTIVLIKVTFCIIDNKSQMPEPKRYKV